jgi:hypothetical protein
MNDLIRYWTSLNGRKRILDAFLDREEHDDLETTSTDGKHCGSDNGSNFAEQTGIAGSLKMNDHDMEEENIPQSDEATSLTSMIDQEEISSSSIDGGNSDGSANGNHDPKPELHARCPLLGRRPQILTYTEEDEKSGSAMSLTENIVWQMNTVFRYENNLIIFHAELKAVDDQLLRVDNVIANIKDHIDNLDATEDAAPHWETLQGMHDTEAELQGERIEWTDKIAQVQRELGIPKEGMYRDIQNALAKHNLLEDISGNDPDHVRWSARVQMAAEPAGAKEPTPSEIAQENLHNEQIRAIDTKGRMEALLSCP